MNSRKLRLSAVLALAACLVLGAADRAGAVAVGINVEVFKNGVSQGTAFGGASTDSDTPLIVTATTGDTLRFVVMLNSNPANDSQSYSTLLPNLDANNSLGGAAEMKFVTGSGVELSGLGFVTINAFPNNQLNDATPTNGNANTVATLTANAVNLYRVDYIMQTVVTDGLRDFNVVLTGYLSSPSGDTIDAATDSASVRVDSGAPVPEPSTLFLLGSGLAALAGMVRRRR